MYILKRDGKEVKRFKTSIDALVHLHKICPASAHHAMKYEGYSITKTKAKKK
jgi:hypothetical protein